MICPNCDSENFGAHEAEMEGKTVYLRSCQDCGYAEEASDAERADVMGEEVDRTGAPIEEGEGE